MQLYFAPLEGITGYTYRNLHHKYYGGVEKYYTPFLSPSPGSGLSLKEVRDALPENNPGIRLVPQIMTNRSADFLKSAETLGELGYREININLGCPSGTVVAKKKGSGFLAYPEEMDRFFDEVFSDGRVVRGETLVSVKTRIGKNSPEEWPRLLEIYGRYPIHELTIHPRVQKDFYKNQPNLDAFGEAVRALKCPLVYNGDIVTLDDMARLRERFPSVETVMIGRGLVRNPELAERILAGEAEDGSGRERILAGAAGSGFDRERPLSGAPGDGFDRERLRAFHDELLERYMELMSGDRNVLFRMKDIWYHLIGLFPNSEKAAKKIRKATRLPEYRAAVDELFSQTA